MFSNSAACPGSGARDFGKISRRHGFATAPYLSADIFTTSYENRAYDSSGQVRRVLSEMPSWRGGVPNDKTRAARLTNQSKH